MHSTITQPTASQRPLLSYSVVLVGIIASGIVIWSSDDPRAFIAGLAILGLTGLTLGRFDLLHPYTWYTPFFVLYSVSMPSLILLGVRADIGSLQETSLMQWIGLSVFLIVVGPVHHRLAISPKSMQGLSVPFWLTFWISTILSTVLLVFVSQRGFSSKLDIALSTDPESVLYPSYLILTLSYTTLLAYLLIRRCMPVMLMIFTLSFGLLGVVILGERDIIFRLGWVTVVLVHLVYRRVPKLILVVAVLVGLAGIPLLGDLKNTALNRSMQVDLKSKTLLTRVLDDEFKTASENLQLLVHTSASWEPKLNGRTLWWDIQRAVLPGSLVRAGPNPEWWFNVKHFPEVVELGGGRGFTLVGEGYMNFGALGVALWFLGLGLFVRYLHSKASRSGSWLTIYVISMPILVLLTRNDYSVLMAQFTKHILIPFFVLCLWAKVVMNTR